MFRNRLHHPWPYNHDLPFLHHPSVYTCCWGLLPPSETLNLHWTPVFWKATTNAWLDTPDSAKPDAPEHEVLLQHTCAAGSTWKLGRRGGVPEEDGAPPDYLGTYHWSSRSLGLLYLKIYFTRGPQKYLFLFELVLRLHQVHIRGYLILHVVHILGTIMIGSLIDAISRGNSMGGTTRVLNPLQFVPLYKGAEEISTGVEPCIRLWWVESLKIWHHVIG